MGRRSDHTREQLSTLILEAARAILREEGQNGISSRKIAKRIGYTVGTIFQVFGNMDRLMVSLNIQTLDALNQACRAIPSPELTEDRLWVLADAFLTFAEDRANEWDAVISYQYTADQTQSEAYRQRIDRLLETIFVATADLYGANDRAQQNDDIRVLWTSLYGIFALSAANRLTEGYDARRMTGALIDMFLGARQG